MYLIHKVPSKVFAKLAKAIFVLAIILLVLTMFIGESVNGADRWLKIPFVPFSFQTSDMAKLALVLYLSRQLVKRKDDFQDLRVVSKYILLPIAITLFLILPSNLSTAALLGFVSLVMLIIAGFPFKWIGLSISAGIATFLLLLMIAKAAPEVLPRAETWRMRIVRMFSGSSDPREDVQINNSLAAIKNGAIKFDNLPKGPGNGVLKRYIPEAYADFYFAALIEEGGLPTAIVVIMLYMWLFFRFIKIGLASNNPFVSYVCIGIGITIVSQAMVNMLVSTKLMPVTGQNMPLLSMGGTSAWFTCIAIGMVLSFSREQQNPESVSKSRSRKNPESENAFEESNH